MDVINCLAYVSNQLTGNGNPPAVDADLENYRRLLREQIDVAPKEKIGGVTYAQDGVVYKDGYRVEKFDDDRLDQLNVKIRELEQRSQEKDQKLDLLNVKLDELERRSVEREIEIEGLRSRSVSRAGSQEPTTSRGVPSIVLGEQQSDTRYGSNRFRPIHREDDSRKTIKKRSVTSNVSEDRSDELDLLSQMEEEEAKKMEDYVPLVYNRDEYLSEGNKRHKISPIQELCQMHEDEHRHRIMEHSPEPNFGANISKPWGDIQLEETKKHEKLAPQAVHDITEETRESDESDELAKSMEETKQWLKSPRNTFPDVSTSTQDLLSPGVFVPSGVRSRSESPEEEHPTLKRTRKKSDLTALLLEEERRAEAFSGVIIQTEESDSEGGRRTEFLQSKSPSPFVGPFIENERYQQSTGQLIALVLDPDEQPNSQEHTRKKRHLTAAQLEEERRAEAFYGVTVPSDESDSEGVNRTEFVRSKSATPNFSTFVEKERFQQSAGQLTPLLTDSEVQSVSQEHPRKKRDLTAMQLEDERCAEAESPTSNVDHQETMHPEERSISQEYQQLSSTSLPLSPSRDATISPAPIASSGSPASPVSSNVDESVKDGLPYYQSGDDRSVSSSSAAGGSVSAAAPVESEENLIFSGEYTKAMSKDWHSGHFCCWQCDESLTGQRYVLRDEHPYCIKCYENVFANVCEECNKTIGIDSKDLSYKDKHWHEACFLCNKCRISLVDKQFGSKADKIYCGNCYDAQFASRCDGCGEIFRAGTKKMEYKTRQWHEKCFCCCVCKTAIGTKSFIPREQEIYCAGCYEEKYATRCIKCKKIITSGGVTYKNEPWHRECFTCTHCTVSLAGQRFTSRDEKPYCAECFGELFAKRCTSCVKPITGIGGTRFISFEDRHWHNDCFICAICKTSLVGRGFITDEQDVICPECAKQKLM
ncbi:paxillin isoform X2 [Culex quinquefasciatus]|nr:paxillin isoform X2 [Culex quinquefasciatus]